MKRVLFWIILAIGLLDGFSCKKGPSLPVLKSSILHAMNGTSAVIFSEILSDGGSTVRSRGICWDINPNPTVYNKLIKDTISGLGAFLSLLDSLQPNTTYYVKAWANNGAGTAYNNQVIFTTASLGIGNKYQGGVIAYIFQPGDTGYIEGEQHGIIASANDISDGVLWGCDTLSVMGAYGTALGTGKSNTDSILLVCETPDIAARLCADYSFKGYDDWYLPSIDELGILYLNRSIIGGFSNNAYWSSTEKETEYALVKYFNFGNVDFVHKTAIKCYVRAIRNF